LRDNFPPSRGSVRLGAQRLWTRRPIDRPDPGDRRWRHDGAPAPGWDLPSVRRRPAADRSENRGLPSHAHRSRKLAARNSTL